MSIKDVYDLIDAANAIFDARNNTPARTENEGGDEEFEYDDPNDPAARIQEPATTRFGGKRP